MLEQGGTRKVELTDGAQTADVLDLGTYAGVGTYILDGSGDPITSFGGGTQYTEGAVDATPTGTVAMWKDAGNVINSVSASTPFPVNIVAGAGSGGTASPDDSTFITGTTNITPAGGIYESVRVAVTDGNTGAVAMTAKRGVYTTLETPNGDSAMDETNDAVRVNVVTSTTVPVSATNLDIRDLSSATDSVEVKQATATNLKAQAEMYQGGSAVAAGNAAYVQPGTNALFQVGATDVADTGNSTTATLAGGAVFTGTAFDVSPYDSWSLTMFSNVASATNGISIQWSDDATNWDVTDAQTLLAGVGVAITFDCKAKYVRLVYTNGASAQASFRVYAFAHPVATRSARKFIGSSIVDQDTGNITIATIQGHSTAGGGAWVPVKVNPSGALTADVTGTVTANAGTNLNTSALALESGGNLATLAGAVTAATVQSNTKQINGVAPSMGNGTVDTGVQRVTIASDSTGQVALAAGSTVTATQATGSNLHTVVDSGTITSVTSITNALPAGTNTIGGTVPSASASGTGLSISKTDALVATATAVKAAAGRVYGYHIYNPNNTDAYVQFYDIAAGGVTVGTSARTETLWIPAQGAIDSEFTVPLTFGTAITIAATTTITGSTAPSTGLLTNIFYL